MREARTNQDKIRGKHANAPTLSHSVTCCLAKAHAQKAQCKVARLLCKAFRRTKRLPLPSNAVLYRCIPGCPQEKGTTTWLALAPEPACCSQGYISVQWPIFFCASSLVSCGADASATSSLKPADRPRNPVHWWNLLFKFEYSYHCFVRFAVDLRTSSPG